LPYFSIIHTSIETKNVKELAKEKSEDNLSLGDPEINSG
jgi:hypothetical protein